MVVEVLNVQRIVLRIETATYYYARATGYPLWAQLLLPVAAKPSSLCLMPGNLCEKLEVIIYQ